ncbi:carbohydrate ABC transporter membrane protein 2, CUT1 family [Picrophilus oshimae DSM 9789]|uniref:Carbohydrate ABC transporter membrane protein 2, CUT1 family n=2 Tax=Picrophilus torridus (strain ATCC 700027 / DSM 9790 / JCM 10055 / NBRC 100828 / KAW 2/3) TaxID=1122961 RepID=A0A8G2FXC6_PICTO|nr:carbohydrate ABC transporter membrane protein 2, CUT1 family [Picrophilus oshimae DSM 9789]
MHPDMKSKNIGSYIIAIILSIIFIYPLYVLILITFEPTYLTFDRLYPYQLPVVFTLSNLEVSFRNLSLVYPVIRSTEVAFIVAFLALLLSIPAGYGLEKLTARLSNRIIILMFVVNMMPALVIAIPISVYFIRLGLENTVIGIALAQELVVLPISVFIMLGGFRSLPQDIENQALVDGATLKSAFARVLLPLIRVPALVTFLIAWMTSWDEFTYAVIISPVRPTFPVDLYDYVSRGEPFVASSFALIVTIPVIIVTVVLQKYLKGEYLSGGLGGV